ncbi:hypothetical protein C8Q72DRAFT_891529 [Fomitopsis betulina]|nr:hypothetical protein C8Q72DRAFT_891529 [Fomitopsis betulina]
MPHEPAQRGGTGSLSDGLTYASAIHVPEYARGNCGARQDATPTETDGYDLSLHTSSSAILPGGLSEADLNRFGGSPLLLTNAYQNQLLRELNTTLSSILNFYFNADADDDIRDAAEFPERIRSQRDAIEDEHRLADTYSKEITQLVQDINELNPRLDEELIDALSTLPPILNARRTAEADLLSTTIEASLMKLSLIRTRTHVALYAHTSVNRHQATMGRALSVAVDKLRTKQLAQDAEEREIDGQLAAYESMLSYVGGREGGFAQVVEDMARVKRETEECWKDLRRLGWTGDQ